MMFGIGAPLPRRRPIDPGVLPSAVSGQRVDQSFIKFEQVLDSIDAFIDQMRSRDAANTALLEGREDEPGADEDADGAGPP